MKALNLATEFSPWCSGNFCDTYVVPVV